MNSALHVGLDEDDKFSKATDLLIERAWQLAPVLRMRSADTEQLRRLPDETMADVEIFMPALVPKRWGGMGLGSRALCEVARELAHGDASTAWTVAFLMEHSWMACHLPWEAQEELFADRNYIHASAPLSPGGTAEPTDGGFLVTGTFQYASGILNSDWTFATALVQEGKEAVPYRFLIPLIDLTVNDDWHMSGMAATGSASVTAHQIFVPERRSLKNAIFDSLDEHPGAVHEEAYLKYPPLGTIGAMMAGIVLGSAEACVEIVRKRLPESKVWGVPRVNLPVARVRWGAARQRVRCAQLLWRHTVDRLIVKCDRVEPWREEETGQTQLDLVTVVGMCHEAVGMLCDGMGTSAYRLDDPLQRYRRDVDTMASHLFLDHDYVSERATRVILGLGYLPTDPYPTRPPRHRGAEQRMAEQR